MFSSCFLSIPTLALFFFPTKSLFLCFPFFFLFALSFIFLSSFSHSSPLMFPSLPGNDLFNANRDEDLVHLDDALDYPERLQTLGDDETMQTHPDALALIRRLLHPDPAKRPSSFKEILEDRFFHPKRTQASRPYLDHTFDDKLGMEIPDYAAEEAVGYLIQAGAREATIDKMREMIQSNLTERIGEAVEYDPFEEDDKVRFEGLRAALGLQPPQDEFEEEQGGESRAGERKIEESFFVCFSCFFLFLCPLFLSWGSNDCSLAPLVCLGECTSNLTSLSR